LRCASLLCEAGARVNARTQNGASPMLVAAQDGHLHVAMLLSSYGAERGPDYLDATGIVVRPSEAETLARDSGNRELHQWIAASYRYLPLHHVRVLTPQRAVELLRAGCSPHARPAPSRPEGSATPPEGSPGAVSPSALPPSEASSEAEACLSPAELARQHVDDPRVPAAKIILRAAEPWSPDTHHLWGARQRGHAVQLCLVGYQLADLLAAAAPQQAQQGAFVDVWLAYVMPLAVSWSSCQACARPQQELPKRSPPLKPSPAPRSVSPLSLPTPLGRAEEEVAAAFQGLAC
jgi:hypothetical protein